MNANVSKFKKTFLALVLVINLSLMLALTAMIVIADENVDVQPDNPLQGQALTCIASGSGPFYYYWYKDGVYQPGYSNTIPAGVTHAGEVWLCEVYVPGPPPWYEPIFYGSDFEVVRQDNDFESITVTANPSTGEEPLQVQLNCNALGGDEPITYAWDFTNDGVIDTSFNQQNSQITHTYNEGTFFARCIARDNDDDQIQGLSNAINVQCSDIDDDGVCDDDEIPFQNIIVTANPSSGVEPLQVLLTCNATGGNEPLSFAWDFTNDGVIDTDFNPLQNQVTHTYSAGDYRARCIVKDNDNDYAQALSNVIHVETQNLAPVCNLTNITMLEDHDSTLNLNNYCYDPEGLPLQYQIIQAPQHLIASLFNNNLYLNPLPDWNGADSLTLLVSDGVNVVEFVVGVVVVPVNDAPVALFNYSPSNPVVGEQVLFNACDSFDVDGDVLTFVWDFGDGVVFSTQDCVTSHVFNVSQCFNVTLSVVDNVLFDVTSQQVCVSNLNQGPVCNLTNITILEDHDLTLDLDDYCFDPDGDVLSYGIVSAPQHLIASLYGSGLYLSPLPDWNGVDSLTLSVSDGLQGFSLYIPITVLPVNDAPVALFSFEPLNPVVGEEVLFNASESFDVDGDVLTYYWDFGDGSSSEGVITHHVYNETGVYHVTLIVSDGLEHSLAVQDLEVLENQPPVCNLTNITLLEDHDLTLNLDDYCYDPEGSALTYSVVQGPQHLVVSLYGSGLYLSPLPDWNGVDSIVLSVGDGFNTVTFDVPIIVVPVDDVIVSVEAFANPLSGVEPLNVTLSCFAVGGDLPLSFAWDFTNDGVVDTEFSPANNVVSHVYGAGSFVARCVVRDSFPVGNPTVAEALTPEIVVSSINHLPICNLSNITLQEDHDLTLNLDDYCFDPDGDVLTYSIVQTPQHLIASLYNHYLYLNPLPNWFGTDLLVLNVSDNENFTMQEVQVIVTPVNDAPVLSQIPSQTIIQGQEFQPINLSLYVYDVDNSFEELSWSFESQNIHVSLVNGIAYLTPNPDWFGTENITFTVTDPYGASDETTTSFTVLQAPQPPVAFFNYQPLQPHVFENVLFNATGSYDPDGFIVQYSWNFGDNSTSQSIQPFAIHNYSTPGNYTVTLTVTDNQGLTSNYSRTIQVRRKQLFVENITCFPKLVVNHEQACSVTVKDDQGMLVQGASVTIKYYPCGNVFGTCNTSIAGSCTVLHVENYLGNKTVYAIAEKTGYEPDLDFNPRFTYQVLRQRYEIRDLATFNDSNFQNFDDEFYRGENLYAKFRVYDLFTGNYVTEDIITEGWLVSAAGGMALMQELPQQGEWFKYWLTIPLNHLFFGNSQVFSFAFNSSDQTGGEAFVNLSILNNPPIIQGLPQELQLTVNDTVVLNLDDYVNDLEDANELLNWELQTNGNAVNAFLQNHELVIQAVSPGVSVLTLTVFDLDNDSDVASINVYVQEQVNQPPVCNLTNITMLEDHNLTINLDDYCSDPEAQSLTYNIIQEPEHLTTVLNQNYLSLTPELNWNGLDVLTLSVSDGVNVVEFVVGVVVVPVNDAPVAVFNYSPSNPVVGEQVLFNACDSFDVDGGVLTFVWDFGDGVVFSTQDCVTSHVFNVSQCFNVTLSVVDNVLFDVVSHEVCVGSVNHGPVCNLSNVTMFEDHDLTLDLDDYCFDPDGDVLSYGIVSAPQYLIASLYGSGLYLSPLPDWNGVDSLTLSVSDGLQGFSLYIPITVLPVNDAPVALFSFEPLSPVVGEEVLFNASESFDVDGDVLTFVWDFGDGSNSEGVITEHVFNTSQCFEVSLTVSDGELSNTTTRQVCVLTQNHGPVCNLSNITMLEDHDLTIDLNNYCYDPDGDVLTFQILTQPEHLNASLQDSELSLTPMQDWNGNDWLSLFVSDGVQSFSLYVPIYVIPVNDAPIVLDIPDQTIVQGQAFQNINLSLYVIDVDNSPSEISWTANGQQHLNVTISNNIASIAYENQWFGSETITFCARDIEGLQDCDTATFTVLYNDLNITSVEATANPSNGVEPLQVLLTCNATDGNEPLSFAWDFTNDGVIDTEFSPANNVLTHTYYQGTYFARCIVKDNDDDTAQALTNQISVQAAQLEPPVARFNYTPPQPRVNELVIFDASQSYDSDGFIVQYSWSFGDNTTVTTSPSPITSHVYTTPGDYVVTLTVVDNDGLTSSYQSVLHVTGALQVASIECFPRVVVNHEQSCSVHVNDWFNPVGNALVTIKDLSTNKTLSTCLTDPITGACSASFIARTVGNRTVFATAEKTGYEPDLDSEPRFTYQVLQQRYTIKRLKLYNCSAFTNCEDYEYFRGEELFAKFLVIDLLNDEPVSKDVITQVWLVSQPGGRVELHQFLEPRQGWFYYWLPSIPLTHEFKGDSQVFSFVFNDSQAGEAVVNMTIKNNAPVIKKLPRITLNIGEETFIDLSSYEQDLEDAGVNLSWSIVTLSRGVEANLSGKVLQVKALQQGLHNIKLKLEDLDHDFAIADLMITVLEQANTAPVVEILNPQDNDTFIVNESFKLIGFAFDNEQGVLPDDAMLWYYRCVNCFSHSDDWRFIRAGNDFDFAISEQGVYQVKLVAFDNQNLTGMDVVTIRIVKQQQQVLIANANGPYYGTVNKPILFNASQSVGALTYTWDFGDGNVITTTQPVIEHVYNHYGVYDVKLTVSNGVETDIDFTKAFVDVQSACNDGIDNDNDGLIDMEDPGCESLKDNSEYNIPLNEGKLQIKKVFIPVARPDDLVPVTVKVLNLGRDLKRLHVSVMVPEAGVVAKTSRFDLRQGAVVSKTVYVPTPSMPGEFVVKVSVSNGVVRHSTYRVLIVE